MRTSAAPSSVERHTTTPHPVRGILVSHGGKRQSEAGIYIFAAEQRTVGLDDRVGELPEQGVAFVYKAESLPFPPSSLSIPK